MNYETIIEKHKKIHDEFTNYIMNICQSNYNGIEGATWYHFEPLSVESSKTVQGWKGHISCVISESFEIFNLVSLILFKHNCSFKVAKNLKILGVLNEIHYPISGANKFMTFYPSNDAHFIAIMDELAVQLKGRTGPRIISDFQCGVGSPLHFRYGGFKPKIEIDREGKIRLLIKNNNDNWVEDIRAAGKWKPEWIDFPYPNWLKKYEKSGMFNDKIRNYRFLKVLARSNKGDVYLAEQVDTNRSVIVKKASPHVVIKPGDADAIWMMKNEGKVLKILEGTGLTPRVIDEFESDGYYFLVQEYITGTVLKAWVGSGVNRDKYDGVISQLRNILDEFHRKSITCWDFTPNNIMVQDDGKLMVFDVETASIGDNVALALGTPGFFNPESRKNKDALQEKKSKDYFALATLILFVYNEFGCYFTEDNSRHPQYRPIIEKVKCIATLSHVAGVLPVRHKKTVNNLLCLSDSNYKKFIALENQFGRDDICLFLDEFVPKMLKNVQNHMHSGAKYLFHSTPFGLTTNPISIQSGLAGVVSFCINILKNDSLKENDEVMCFLHHCAGYLKRYSFTIEYQEQNSYLFGLHGIGWLMFELANFLDDRLLYRTAIDLVTPLDVFDENKHFDLALGTAGFGLCNLKYWMETKDEFFYHKVGLCAKRLITNADDWMISINSEYTEVGTDLGFAHGASGIIYFLYLINLLEQNEVYENIIQSQLTTIISNTRKIIDRYNSGNLRMLTSWCNGLSGIGTALVRIDKFEKDVRIKQLIDEMNLILSREFLKNSPCHCHGNASIIEFLMDAYEVYGDIEYSNLAMLVARFVFNQRSYGNEPILPNETLMDSSYDYGIGTTGALYALTRVVGKAERMFMLDEMQIVANKRA